MNKMIKLICITLLLAVFVTACREVVVEGKYQNFRYVLFLRGIVIIGYTGNNTDINIPSRIRNRPVIAIGGGGLVNNSKGAFQDKNINNVVLPDTIEVIFGEAFADNNLKKVCLPSSLIEIEFSAFRNNQLTSIVIPNSVQHRIGHHAFENNEIVDITIGSGVTDIGIAAFRNNKIRSLYLSSNISTIGNNAFENNKLTSLTIPSGVRILPKAFLGNNITQLVIGENVHLFSGAFKGNNITKIVAGENVQLLILQPDNVSVFDLDFDDFFIKNNGQSGEYVYKEGCGWRFTPNYKEGIF